MNWKGWKGKRSWPNFTHYPGIRVYALEKPTKTWVKTVGNLPEIGRRYIPKVRQKNYSLIQTARPVQAIKQRDVSVPAPPGATQPIVGVYFTAVYWALASLFSRFLDHTQRRVTVGRTPLDEWSIRRRDLYLTTHNTHNRQTSMRRVGFEPTIAAGDQP